MNDKKEITISIEFNDVLLDEICAEELELVKVMLPELVKDTLIQIELEKE